MHALEVQTLALKAALESDRRTGTTRNVSETAPESGTAPHPLADHAESPSPAEVMAAPKKAPAPPTEADVQRFRELQEAVRREDRIKKNSKRVDGILDKLGVNLTPTQRKQVHAAAADFEPNVNRIWGEVKEEARATVKAGGEVDRGEIVTSTMARIQTEFAATLMGVVGHQADAQAIAEALHPSNTK